MTIEEAKDKIIDKHFGESNVHGVGTSDYSVFKNRGVNNPYGNKKGEFIFISVLDKSKGNYPTNYKGYPIELEEGPQPVMQ